MESDPGRDADARDAEQRQHTADLPYEYYMARYPVTVAQFEVFVQASGYKPRDEDCLRGLPNHPVVWVNWHDALAYCEWLTVRLREWSETPEPLAHGLRTACGVSRCRARRSGRRRLVALMGACIRGETTRIRTVRTIEQLVSVRRALWDVFREVSARTGWKK